MICTAKSKRSGEPCKSSAITGARVCIRHGGAAPQVKAKALERLAALVDPAISALDGLLKSEQDNVRLGAVKDVLDRNGFKPTDKVEQVTLTYDAGQLAKLTEEELAILERITSKLTIAGSDPSGDTEAFEAQN